MKLTAQQRAFLKAAREQREFAERAHRRQMIGNLGTSFFQSLAANRPLQVASAYGLIKVGRASTDMIAAAARREQAPWQAAVSSLAADVTELGLGAGMIAYLTNSDGGASIAYDIPDVESPKGGDLLGAGGPWFPVPPRRRPS